MSVNDTGYWQRQMRIAIRVALLGSLMTILLAGGRHLQADAGLVLGLWAWFLAAATQFAGIGWRTTRPVVSDWLAAEREEGGFLYRAPRSVPPPPAAPEESAPPSVLGKEEIAPVETPGDGDTEPEPKALPVVEGAPHGRPVVTEYVPAIEPITKPLLEPKL